MNAPPAQYTKTSDGYSIAYMVSGEGPTLVFMPQLYQHSQWLWRDARYGATLRYWANRLRVIQYDSRGQGMSQRGLPDDHSMAAYERDLDAVIGAVGAKTVVLHASNHFGHVAIRYAVEHAELVAAVILHNTGADGTFDTLTTEQMVEVTRSDWDLALRIVARTIFPKSDGAAMVRYFQESTTQADQLKFLPLQAASSVKDIAHHLTMPTLIISTPHDLLEPGSHDYGKLLAPLIKGSRLVIRDNPYARQGETTDMALYVESFLEEAGYFAAGEGQSTRPDGLSAREVEALRLIAAGRSNAQIAEALVISPNTVGRHVSNIFDKIGAANRAEAASYATRQGLV